MLPDYSQDHRFPVFEVVKATHRRHVVAYLAFHALFMAYVFVLTVLWADAPGWTERYLQAARGWIDWIGGVIPYLETKVRKVAEGRFPHRTELVRHVLTVMWIQIYSTLAITLPFVKSIAESVADRLGASKSDRDKVGVAFRFATVGTLIAWAFWAIMGPLGLEASSRSGRLLFGFLSDVMISSLGAALTSWCVAFVIVCIRVQWIWRRTSVEPSA